MFGLNKKREQSEEEQMAGMQQNAMPQQQMAQPMVQEEQSPVQHQHAPQHPIHRKPHEQHHHVTHRAVHHAQAHKEDFHELMHDALRNPTDIIKRLELIQFIDEELKKFLLERDELEAIKFKLNHIHKDLKNLILDPETNKLHVVIDHNEEVRQLEEDLCAIFDSFVKRSKDFEKIAVDRKKLFETTVQINSQDISNWGRYLENLFHE
ncbi:MAG: hypothetical protein H6502_01205 [Candidatus Woesearchaeota archaeon]|nr:MAG: hypothetical protein H6502_01205 [Candidatus Woesearchaeota archaeon]